MFMWIITKIVGGGATDPTSYQLPYGIVLGSLLLGTKICGSSTVWLTWLQTQHVWQSRQLNSIDHQFSQLSICRILLV
jgi:hypothetical protein